MCGIVGYVGEKNANEVLIAGLKNWSIEGMILVGL